MDVFDQNSEFSLLYELTAIPFQTRDFNQLTSSILQRASTLFTDTCAVFYLFQENSSDFILVNSGENAHSFPKIIPFLFKTGQSDTVTGEDSLEIAPAAFLQKHLMEKMPQLKQSLYAKVKTNNIYGIIFLGRFHEEEFPSNYQFVINVLANQMSLAIDYFLVSEKMKQTLSALEDEQQRAEILHQQLAKQQEENKELSLQLSLNKRTDDLTNLLNRGAIFEFLEREKERISREMPPRNEHSSKISNLGQEKYTSRPRGEFLHNNNCFTVAILDIDHFQEINDNHGNDIGDRVLKEIGEILLKEGVLRRIDLAGRFSGEEFIVIFPGTRDLVALYPVVRLCKALKEKNFFGKDEQRIHFTVSIGLSQSLLSDKSVEDVIQRAFKAMHYAKEHGRNQIVINQCNNNYLRFRSNDELFNTL